ncbi:hypothetical protein Dimus_036288 [Dionaea muscipula]
MPILNLEIRYGNGTEMHSRQSKPGAPTNGDDGDRPGLRSDSSGKELTKSIAKRRPTCGRADGWRWTGLADRGAAARRWIDALQLGSEEPRTVERDLDCS